MTGRRLLKDQTKEYRTLIVGGVKAKRLSFSEYETSIEVLNTFGESKCPLYLDKTEAREGAAGAFFEGTLPTGRVIFMEDHIPKRPSRSLST